MIIKHLIIIYNIKTLSIIIKLDLFHNNKILFKKKIRHLGQ